MTDADRGRVALLIADKDMWDEEKPSPFPCLPTKPRGFKTKTFRVPVSGHIFAEMFGGGFTRINDCEFCGAPAGTLLIQGATGNKEAGLVSLQVVYREPPWTHRPDGNGNWIEACSIPTDDFERVFGEYGHEELPPAVQALIGGPANA